MANPRQRRKARSSSHRPVSLSKRAKKNLNKTHPIRGPKVLQDAWDKKKTVRQNYAAFGLVHTLNPTASGGSEQLSKISPATLVESGNITDTPDIFNATRKGFGRIIRDEAGKVVQVTLNPEDTGDRFKDNSEVMREPEITQDAREKWVTNLGRQNDGTSRLEEYVTVEALERISAKTITVARHRSQGEIKYLQRLADKYGNDVEQMARDRKLNADQRTAGELRRALRRAGQLAAGKGTGKDPVYGVPNAAQ